MHIQRNHLYRVGLCMSLLLLLFLPSAISRAQESEPSLEPADYIPEAQTQAPDTFFRGIVREIIAEDRTNDPETPLLEQVTQRVLVECTSGAERGMKREVRFFPTSADPAQLLSVGTKVVVMRIDGADQPSYVILDRYRLDAVMYGVLLFFVIVVLLTGMRGIRSLAGLMVSIVVVVFFIVPQILAGASPLLICFVGALGIACTSLYLAHGFTERTTVALISTLGAIVLALIIAQVAVYMTGLFGSGTEEAVYAQLNEDSLINLRGLLLGGMIVGVLGILDDITTAQAAVVDELKKANPSFSVYDLYQRGISVGREHISSLINTLVLAYVGASFPTLLLFQRYQQPLFVILNSELIAEEIVRTLVGSLSLITAVPLTTYAAAWWFGRKKTSDRVNTNVF